MSPPDKAEGGGVSPSLGGRLALLDPNTLAGDGKALYDRVNATAIPWSQKAGFEIRTQDGRLIGPFNPILYSPVISSSLLDLQDAEQKHTCLTARVRQVVILSVGAVRHCDYERYAHAAVSKTVGLSPEAITALRNGQGAPDLNAQEDVARRYTLQLVSEPRIDDALYAEAQTSLGDKGLVDLAMLAGIYQLVSGLLNGFAIPVP